MTDITKELADALRAMLEQFTRTPSSLKDSETRIRAHAALARYDAQAPAQGALPEHQRTAPDAIWLHDGDDSDALPFPDGNSGAEVTWSADNATGAGVPYVRADLATHQPGLQDAQPAQPVYDRSVVARIATQMGWTPPAAQPVGQPIQPGCAVVPVGAGLWAVVSVAAQPAESVRQSADFDQWMEDRYPDRDDRQSEFRMTSARDLMREAFECGFGAGCVRGPEVAQRAPSTDAAYEMGAKGGPAVEAERLAFESWMAGHCWALCATWTGTEYLNEGERGGWPDPQAMATRRLWAAWRDRAALSATGKSDPQVTGMQGEKL